MFLRNSTFLNKVLSLNTDTNIKLHLLYLHIFIINSNLKENGEIKIYWTDYLKTIGFSRPEGVQFKEQFINIFNEINKITGICFYYPKLEHIGRSSKDYFLINDTNFLDLNFKLDYEINEEFLGKNSKNKNGKLLGFFLINEFIKQEQIEIKIEFLEKFLILNQEKKENAKIIKKHFQFFQQVEIIKNYNYTHSVFFLQNNDFKEKSIPEFSVIKNNIKVNQNPKSIKNNIKVNQKTKSIKNNIKVTQQSKSITDYMEKKEFEEILKEHDILSPFAKNISTEPKIEKDIQLIIENELKNSEHVKQVQPFRKISGIGEIDTLVELKNGRYLVIEYKFSQDKRVLSQVLGYSFFISKELNIDIEKIDNIVIQKNFKFSDYGVKTFFKNMYFYSWEFNNNLFELKTPSFEYKFV